MITVGEKIVVDGVEWTLESADAYMVEFVTRPDGECTGGISCVVSRYGVNCTDWDDDNGGPDNAPIEVVEAAIRIWRELQTG